MMKLHSIFLVLGAGVSAHTVEDQSFLGIFAETHSMRIAGVKMREMPKLPPGITLPASVRAMMPGAPSRILTVRLWSPSIAPDNASAFINPPTGLKIGDKLDLALYRPTPPSAPASGGTGGSGESGSGSSDFTIKYYWGSSDTVQQGQPKVFSLGSMTNAQKMEMSKQMQAMRRSKEGAYYYKDNWTTGYWPTSDQPGEVGKDSSLVGSYSLHTNYTGNVELDVPSDVDFLSPIEVTSPDLGTKPDLQNSLPLQWNPIANALGQYATIFGMEGKNTLIIWSSSDSFNNQLMADQGFLQMSDVKDRVTNHLFMPGDQTKVTVPSGIFGNATFAMFNMVAYGPGAAREGVQPVPRLQIKSTLQIILKTGKGSGDRAGGSDR